MNSTVSVKVVKAKPVVVPPPTYKLTLELTERDAIALLTLVGNINGSTDNSPRRLTSDIWDALKKAGVKLDKTVIDIGYVKFNDYKN